MDCVLPGPKLHCSLLGSRPLPKAKNEVDWANLPGSCMLLICKHLGNNAALNALRGSCQEWRHLQSASAIRSISHSGDILLENSAGGPSPLPDWIFTKGGDLALLSLRVGEPIQDVSSDRLAKSLQRLRVFELEKNSHRQTRTLRLEFPASDTTRSVSQLLNGIPGLLQAWPHIHLMSPCYLNGGLERYLIRGIAVIPDDDWLSTSESIAPEPYTLLKGRLHAHLGLPDSNAQWSAITGASEPLFPILQELTVHGNFASWPPDVLYGDPWVSLSLTFAELRDLTLEGELLEGIPDFLADLGLLQNLRSLKLACSTNVKLGAALPKLTSLGLTLVPPGHEDGSGSETNTEGSGPSYLECLPQLDLSTMLRGMTQLIELGISVQQSCNQQQQQLSSELQALENYQEHVTQAPGWLWNGGPILPPDMISLETITIAAKLPLFWLHGDSWGTRPMLFTSGSPLGQCFKTSAATATGGPRERGGAEISREGRAVQLNPGSQRRSSRLSTQSMSELSLPASLVSHLEKTFLQRLGDEGFKGQRLCAILLQGFVMLYHGSDQNQIQGPKQQHLPLHLSEMMPLSGRYIPSGLSPSISMSDITGGSHQAVAMDTTAIAALAASAAAEAASEMLNIFKRSHLLTSLPRSASDSNLLQMHNNAFNQRMASASAVPHYHRSQQVSLIPSHVPHGKVEGQSSERAPFDSFLQMSQQERQEVQFRTMSGTHQMPAGVRHSPSESDLQQVRTGAHFPRMARSPSESELLGLPKRSNHRMAHNSYMKSSKHHQSCLQTDGYHLDNRFLTKEKLGSRMSCAEEVPPWLAGSRYFSALGVRSWLPLSLFNQKQHSVPMSLIAAQSSQVAQLSSASSSGIWSSQGGGPSLRVPGRMTAAGGVSGHHLLSLTTLDSIEDCDEGSLIRGHHHQHHLGRKFVVPGCRDYDYEDENDSIMEALGLDTWSFDGSIESESGDRNNLEDSGGHQNFRIGGNVNFDTQAAGGRVHWPMEQLGHNPIASETLAHCTHCLVGPGLRPWLCRLEESDSSDGGEVSFDIVMYRLDGLLER